MVDLVQYQTKTTENENILKKRKHKKVNFINDLQNKDEIKKIRHPQNENDLKNDDCIKNADNLYPKVWAVRPTFSYAPL